MCQIIPIQSQDNTLSHFQNHTPHYHLTRCSPLIQGHLTLQCTVREGILSDLSSVRTKFLADDLQSGGGEFPNAPYSFTLGYPSSHVAEYLQQRYFMSEKEQQQLCNHYYILSYNNYEVQSSMSI